jgi:repressor LexA
MQLTPRQADVILLIRNHRHLYGHSPTIREIATTLGLSRATTVGHLARMEAKNLIRRHPKAHRTLEVVEDIQGVKPKPTPKDRRKAEAHSLDTQRQAG